MYVTANLHKMIILGQRKLIDEVPESFWNILLIFTKKSSGQIETWALNLWSGCLILHEQVEGALLEITHQMRIYVIVITYILWPLCTFGIQVSCSSCLSQDNERIFTEIAAKEANPSTLQSVFAQTAAKYNCFSKIGFIHTSAWSTISISSNINS